VRSKHPTPPSAPARPSLYVVRWLDILSDSTWVGEDPTKAIPATCVTVGWIVHSCPKKLIMADSKTDDGDWGGLTVIPTGVVVEKMRISSRAPESFLRDKQKKKK